MAGEFVHSSVGTTMTQSEFEAIGLHICNNQATGDLIYASSASQLSRLAIGNGVLYGTGGTPAWATTIAGMTLTSPTINACTISGTFTGVGRPIFPAALAIVGGDEWDCTTDNSYLTFRGGTAAAGTGVWLLLTGKTYGTPGAIQIYTPNAAGTADILRLSISGVVATAVATWSTITHTDLNLGDYIGLFKTDIDSAVEAELWYDDSENVLKYFNGAAVKTLAVVA